MDRTAVKQKWDPLTTDSFPALNNARSPLYHLRSTHISPLNTVSGLQMFNFLRVQKPPFTIYAPKWTQVTLCSYMGQKSKPTGIRSNLSHVIDYHNTPFVISHRLSGLITELCLQTRHQIDSLLTP